MPPDDTAINETLNNILLEIQKQNESLDSIYWALSFAIGVFACAYFFTFIRDIFAE